MYKYKEKDYDEPLTVPHVCHRLGIHKTTAYNLIHSGELVAFNIGPSKRGIRVLTSEVEKYKKKNKVKPYTHTWTT